MNNIRGLRAFVEVARCGSFVDAAERLDQSSSTTSRLVQEVEAELGLTLFRRTTRRVSLTDAGTRYFERCRDLLAELDALSRDAGSEAAEPSGLLHVSTSLNYARCRLAPLLPAFTQRYPQVQVQLHLDEKKIDIVDEGIDVAIRLGSPNDSSMVARHLGNFDVWMVAAPSFIAEHGQPQHLQDVARLPCLVDTKAPFKHRWPLGDDVIPVQGPAIADDPGVIAVMANAGMGLALLPDFTVAASVAEGRLKRLFADELPFCIDIYALFPGRKQITAPARAFADFLSESFGKRT